MPRFHSLIAFAGVAALLAAEPIWAQRGRGGDDGGNSGRGGGQIRQQIQQRAQSQPRSSSSNQPRSSSSNQPRSSGSSSSPGGSIRSQIQQRQPSSQPRSTNIAPRSTNISPRSPSSSPPSGPRDLPGGGSISNFRDRLGPTNPSGGGRGQNLSGRDRSAPNLENMRDRLPHTSGVNPGLPRTRENTSGAEQQLRQRLQDRVQSNRDTNRPGDATPSRDPRIDNLRDRIETLKPNTGTNLNETPTDRLRDAQRRDILRDTQPGGNLRDRLPNAGDRPNLGDRPNIGDRGDLGDRVRDNLGDRLPNAGNLRDRVPNIGDRRDSENLRDRTDNLRDRADNLRERGTNLRDLDDNLRDRGDDVRDRLDNARDRTDNLRDRADNARDRTDNLRDRADNLRDRTTPLRIDRNGALANLRDRPELRDQLRDRIRNPRDLERTFDRLRDLPELTSQLRQANLRLTDLSGAFQTRVRNDGFNRLTQIRIADRINLNRQFSLAVHGDVARQLGFHQTLIRSGGWGHRNYIGPVWGGYTQNAFSAWYAGPGFYPAYAWMPVWSPWVSWTFWDYVLPIYDPRPFLVRPVIYDPCPPIVVYDYPVWEPLPVVSSGTWVDVPEVVIDSGFDLQLLAVRFVDPGHREQDLGPRFRIWVRNNSPAAIGDEFNVTLVAANGADLAGQLPQAGVTVPSMDAETVVPIDIRLPIDANRINVLENGQRTPFTHLHVLVDSHRDLRENDESNNGAILERRDILPVDPAAFSTDVTAAAPGSLVSLAGEGFGPEPGELIVVVDGQQVAAEIYGWYDLGINFKVPNLDVSGPTPVDVLVIRGDGAASNPVAISITPEQMLSEAPLPPQPIQ